MKLKLERHDKFATSRQMEESRKAGEITGTAAIPAASETKKNRGTGVKKFVLFRAGHSSRN